MSYQVLVDDNFHYQDEAHRFELGVFATADEAVAACRSIVDEFLTDQFKPGMTAGALYELYMMFGEDPFIRHVNPKNADVEFSAWDYARQRCSEIAGG